MPNPLRILVLEPDPNRATAIKDALTAGGWSDVTVLPEMVGLARRLTEINPDIVLIDLTNPSRDVLEQVSAASDAKGRPVAMFVDQSDDNMTSAAVAAGLSAYVVGDLVPERIKPVLQTAIARFQMMSQMRLELEVAKKALADRKIIDRAKGLLMRAKGISEDQAYALLRSTAMDQKRKVIDVAEALITATDLLR
ncbi:ANTAR domain-containing response regulator [Pseudorhodobacter wandonensis]|jgi:two-component system, response regulator / RNA-binding antiterminator|uniref:ANTAR domain-containing response regulator n=1 Tax=Pseudorhodobacter wandonensis TaxID=1120568 RepID=UPI00067B1EC8|nr:ANTAR domain-containing protein [Pseudorhodobacter wandonensis]